jgi:hypothetical protein
MRRSIMALRILVVVVLLLCARGAMAQQPSPSQPPLPQVDYNVEVLGSKVVEFSAKMDAYAALRRSLEKGIPPLAVTDNPNDIRRAEQLLAERIRRARAGAGRGDIFTEETRRAFRQILRPVTNAGVCEAIRDDNPGEFQYAINAEYPKDRPVSTVPPSVLAALPRLPEDVWYRFLGRDLILHDSRANVILDRIDDAIRCSN